MQNVQDADHRRPGHLLQIALLINDKLLFYHFLANRILLLARIQLSHLMLDMIVVVA